ncbi:hypothetical protein RJ639_006193 [Escallonia herrerae]|uniref:Uncharacterized protein n=1 Tax=Escallonia herrerae TaxID=1293975 RepID=A0AA89AYR3_9ASTE|nr:hypothetical protein RJ639_006193 [Escallonia herrerae]
MKLLKRTDTPTVQPPKQPQSANIIGFHVFICNGGTRQIPGLHLYIEDHQVVMDNGFVKVTLSTPEGLVTGISYKGVEVLENRNEETNRGYWDIVWNNTSAKSSCQMDKFVMLPQSSGFYTYAILEHLQGWPDFDVQEARIAFKLQENIFHYMAMSDQRQRIMPMPVDRGTGEVLDYPEAVLLTHPVNPDLKDEGFFSIEV